ncbi:MAG: hypothetical protein M1821_009343 [Bathelium mastoideum]|nr:MAG: hypothetical protein M1821_009343 [Bathelium mastoideum]
MAKSHPRRDEGRRRPERRRKRRRPDPSDQSSRCIERSSRGARTLEDVRAARVAYFGSTPEQRSQRRDKLLPSRMSYVADSRPRAVSSKSSSRGGARSSDRDRDYRRKHPSSSAQEARRSDARVVDETVYVYRRAKEDGGSRRHATRPPEAQGPTSPSRSRSSQNTQSTPRSLRRTRPTRTANAPRDEYQEAQQRTVRAEPAPAPVAAPPPTRRTSTQHRELRYTAVPAADAARVRQSVPAAEPSSRTRNSTIAVEPQKTVR